MGLHRARRPVRAAVTAAALTGILLPALLPALLPGPGLTSAAATSTRHGSASPRLPTPVGVLTTRAFLNDPRATGDASNVPRNLVAHHFDHAPAGSVVRVTTWNLTDPAIAAAMVAAMRRGVKMRLIMARANCDEEAAEDVIAAARAQQQEGGSSAVLCATGSTRVAGGTMHQKSYAFSAVGDVAMVTVLGSANATVEGYADQWVDLFQYVRRRDVYTAYNRVFALQWRKESAGADMRHPYRSFSFAGGVAGAQFFPVDARRPVAGDDPVLRRLQTIPARRGTVILVARYAMQGRRGSWLTSALIRHRRAGSRVEVVTGPPVGNTLEDRLRRAGVPVTRAFRGPTGTSADCERDLAWTEDDNDCDYIHLKLMTGTYVKGGRRQYRSWTGSDNWSDASLRNDEVAHKVAGIAPYRQYVAFVRTIQRTY